ncbi:hypothetical protein SAMN04515667_1846 [Formosa sp. Hel1_31_208]|uniref:hypothetical protein n=1 Tax=Formosa sp. Hel1_31_208 TaxID=1798225 RepID=UPI0008793F00|nr:hypothetical protein [Formosa sp. Hel1_31_208]SDS29297.1 hypothetical protein SAMN04515667_1846 [Formosa sp. Hel1_31_208]
MKRILAIISCILILTVLACSHGETKKERLKNAIIQFNNDQRSINSTLYYPESYTEIKTDSIVGHTFKVSIKNYATSDHGILLNQSVINDKKTTEYHRLFASDVIVAVSDHIIFEKHISAKGFGEFTKSTFWTNATLEHVWVNQNMSNNSQLSLGVSFINPKDDTFKLYELLIDTNGNEQIILIQDHS